MTEHVGYVTLDSGKRRRYVFASQTALAKAELDRGEDFEDAYCQTAGGLYRSWVEASKAKAIANGYGSEKATQAVSEAKARKARNPRIAEARAKARKATR